MLCKLCFYVSKQKPIIFIELNEFNRDLLEECANRFELKTLKKLFLLNETKTYSRDSYDSNFLEPWSQWVTVHTGRRTGEHMIKHLGDISNLTFPQIWERLSELKISSGVWGAINGGRGNAEHCHFFLPDPWTFSEETYPKNLGYLVNFPRYLAKNRKNIKAGKIFYFSFEFLSVLKNFEVIKALFFGIPRLLLQVMKEGIKEYSFFTLFEYMSSLEFIRMQQKTRPEISFLFINSIAHLQHYYWNFKSKENISRFKYTLTYIDRILSKLDKLDCDLIVYNALSQVSTTNEATWTGYRPHDHDDFLNYLKITYKSVEPLMSSDAILLFAEQSDLIQGKKILESLSINGSPLLVVDIYENDKLRLFYRVATSHQVHSSEMVESKELQLKFRFLDQLAPIAVRTGKHSAVGNIFASLPIFPDNIENKDVMKHVEKHLLVR